MLAYRMRHRAWARQEKVRTADPKTGRDTVFREEKS
jgi:hypothetical protein